MKQDDNQKLQKIMVGALNRRLPIEEDEEEQIVRFRDLSWPLKVAVTIAWLLGICWALIFAGAMLATVIDVG